MTGRMRLYWLLTLAAVASLGGVVDSCADAGGARDRPPSEGQDAAGRLAVAALADDPAQWVGRTVRVQGELRNAGTNYFTDLRIVLRSEGSEIFVRPWLPLEVPPGPQQGKPPPTLSDFLGRRVDLEGTWTHGSLGRQGTQHFLTVTRARVLQAD